MDGNIYTPKQLAEKLHVSKETLRLWADKGRIHVIKTDGGHRRYIYNSEEGNKKNNFIYARVSSAKQKRDRDRQVKQLEKKYPHHAIITDIGSGINFKRKGLISILESVFEGNVGEIVIAYKDRLTRFGFELFEMLFKHFSTTLTVVNNNDNETPETELAEDLMSIITVFTARYYGSRKYKSQ